MTYGVRYLRVSHFISYCQDLNVRTSERELEHYEKEGILLPTARVVKPDDYVRREYDWQLHPGSAVTFDEWPDMERLYERLRDSSITDAELIDSFDREFGHNPYLLRPDQAGYTPWNSYKTVVAQIDGQDIHLPTAEQYYSHWQVHQLFFIRQSPDLFENFQLLESLCETCKARQHFRPWVMDAVQYRTFEGMTPFYDALSFYITTYERERRRTFALIPMIHGVKTLDDTQHQAYRTRLRTNAQYVMTQYSLTEDQLYTFLGFLVDKLMEYRDDERTKLANAVSRDIQYQALLIWGATGRVWEDIAEELGSRSTYWIKQAFRRLDPATKVRDTAREFLSHVYKKLEPTMTTLGIPDTAIDEILRFCEDNDLSLLLHTLDESIATLEEEWKFLRVSRYITFKNIATSLEYFLKAIALKAVPLGRSDLTGIEGETLFPIITKVMKNETTWIGVLKSGTYSTKAGPTHFSPNLSAIQSEANDIARHFLISCLARNLTVHSYPTDDWFYGDVFGEFLSSLLIALFYTWHVARREHWV